MPDGLTDWAAYLLGNHATVWPYARPVFGAMSTAKSYLLPLVDQVSQKPDLATIALLVLIIFVSLKVLNMLWQTFLFWVRMIWSIVFWGGLLAIGLWLYTRGPDGVAEDMQRGFDTWNAEYKHYKNQERVAKLMNQGYRGRQAAGWY